VTAAPLIEGSGFVECAHGRFPLPAPATLEILRGLPLSQCAEPGERITPTGAALLAEFCAEFGPMPGMKPLAAGFGLGSRDVPGRPNVLRLILGEAAKQTGSDEVALLEANLDDLSPELAAAALESLFEAGALDAWTTPAHMKKNRPGFVLAALAPPPSRRNWPESSCAKPHPSACASRQRAASFWIGSLPRFPPALGR
ncbi:MAG: LarC family nickel insertion protein, partial [Terrimicrobiaceae bacterium]|nr:LarC family nickel insertion protein [Terrimicrobiaceae bacterium]